MGLRFSRCLCRRAAHGCCASRTASTDEHAALPLPGCGHFITEAAIRSFIPPGGRLLIPMTGSYSDRMIRLAREAGRDPVPMPIAADGEDSARCGRRRSGTRSVHHPCRSRAVGNRQRRRARCRCDRRGGQSAWTPHDRRRGVGVRRAADGHERASGNRRRGVHREQVPGRPARHRLRDRADRSAGAMRRHRRQLVVRSFRCLRAGRSAAATAVRASRRRRKSSTP